MCAPGDVICMTPLIRDLVRAYPDRFDIGVFTSCPSLWEHNPHVDRILASPLPGVPFHKLDYGQYIADANVVPLHFLTAFHREFERQTGLPVPVTEPKPDLHLSEQERNERLIDGRYWLMFAGGKSDFTVKIWSTQFCQQVVNGLAKFGIRVVQTGGTYQGHKHPALDNVLNIVGQAGLRDTLRLIAQADGVLCPITFGMHAAAAFERPCVIWAGGREHWWWEAYVNHPTIQNFGPVASGKVRVQHKYLHTQGLLDCCKHNGCWMNKVRQEEADGAKRYCRHPVDDGYGQVLPLCQQMITPHHVIAAVLGYYEDGTLDPIGPVPKIILPTGQELLPQDLVGVHPATTPTPLPVVVGNFEGQGNFVAGTNQTGLTCRIEDPMDNVLIGGKYTVCVHLQGDDHAQHRKCLGSVLMTIPQHRRELRIVLNGACAATEEWIRQLSKEGYIHTLGVHPQYVDKFAAMRSLLHQEDNPIATPYIVWFDDRAVADKDTQWWAKLAQTIINHHPLGCRMFGPTFTYKLPVDWVATQPWYRQRQHRLQNGVQAAAGDKTLYAHTAFCAISAVAVRELDLPQVAGYTHGDDWMLGEQLWQAGYNVKHWNGQKQFVTY